MQQQPIPVIMEDELVHILPSRPFCSSVHCDCHVDAELLGEFIAQPIERGELTIAEARHLWAGGGMPDADNWIR